MDEQPNAAGFMQHHRRKAFVGVACSIKQGADKNYNIKANVTRSHNKHATNTHPGVYTKY